MARAEQSRPFGSRPRRTMGSTRETRETSNPIVPDGRGGVTGGGDGKVGALKHGIYKILMSRAKLGFQVVRRRNLQQSISYLNLGPLLLQDLVDSFILPPSPLSPF